MHLSAACCLVALIGLPDLVDDPRPGYLGINIITAVENGVEGVRVSIVKENQPAAASGLRVGDLVLELDGKRVKESHELVEHIGKSPPGRAVAFKLLRDGKLKTLRVLVGVRPDLQSFLVRKNPPRVEGPTTPLLGGVINGDMLGGGNDVLRGQVIVAGDYKKPWHSVLDVVVAGRDNHAALEVRGAVSLAGVLYVSLGDFEPKPGDKFEIISAAEGLSGRFDKLMLPELADDLHWNVAYDNLAADRDLDGDGRHDVTLVIEKRGE